METVKQSVNGGQEKLQQLWLEWSRKQPGAGDGEKENEQVMWGLTGLVGFTAVMSNA